MAKVALLAEGVDRNRARVDLQGLGNGVALLAEGVDRNEEEKAMKERRKASPSSRRAWIEIELCLGEANQSGRRPPRGGRG